MRDKTFLLKIKKKELTAEEKAEAKIAFMAAIRERKQDPTRASMVDLKERIMAIHNQIVRCEAEKYDLEKRLELQQYDVCLYGFT